MIHRVLYSLMLCGLVLAVAGCSWSRGRVNIDNFYQKVTAVEKGKSRAADLEALFGGAPTEVKKLGDGKELHIYTFGESKTEGFNLILIGFSVTNTGMDVAAFEVDSNGIVQDVTYSENSKDLEWDWWPF